VFGYDTYRLLIKESGLLVYNLSELMKTSIESSSIVGKFSYPICALFLSYYSAGFPSISNRLVDFYELQF
jgi:hypothetical protein